MIHMRDHATFIFSYISSAETKQHGSLVIQSATHGPSNQPSGSQKDVVVIAFSIDFQNIYLEKQVQNVAVLFNWFSRVVTAEHLLEFALGTTDVSCGGWPIVTPQIGGRPNSARTWGICASYFSGGICPHCQSYDNSYERRMQPVPWTLDPNSSTNLLLTGCF